MYGDHSGEFVSGYWGLKLCANGCNNSQHCWPNNIGSCCICFHMAKSLTGFILCTTTPDNTQQPATTCNRVCKQTQLVISNNGGSSWPKVLGPFFFWAWVLKGKDMMDTLLCPKEAQLKYSSSSMILTPGCNADVKLCQFGVHIVKKRFYWSS